MRPAPLARRHHRPQQPQITLDGPRQVPAWFRLVLAVRRATEDGSLRPGDRLEPMAHWARRLNVSLPTVRHAFTALSAEGVLTLQEGTFRVVRPPGGDSDEASQPVPQEEPPTRRPLSHNGVSRQDGAVRYCQRAADAAAQV